jgi:hypothetical protein
MGQGPSARCGVGHTECHISRAIQVLDLVSDYFFQQHIGHNTNFWQHEARIKTIGDQVAPQLHEAYKEVR